MPRHSIPEQSHTHAGRFFQGLVVAIVLGLLIVGIVQATRARKRPSVSFEKQLEDGIVLLQQDRLDDAERFFASSVEEAQAKVDSNGNIAFSNALADACYYLAATRYRQIEMKYKIEREEAVADPDKRFVPPEKDIEPLRLLLRRGIKANPEHARLWRLLGVADNWTGRYQSAAESLEKAIAINDRFVEAYNDLGLVYLNRRDFSKAREYFEKALLVSEKEGPPPAVHFNLGMFYSNLNQGHPSPDEQSKAIRHLEAFLKKETGKTTDRKTAESHLSRLKQYNPTKN